MKLADTCLEMAFFKGGTSVPTEIYVPFGIFHYCSIFSIVTVIFSCDAITNRQKLPFVEYCMKDTLKSSAQNFKVRLEWQGLAERVLD
jgi:hypothetical protein